jgi:DNA replication protein DnaC
MTDADDLNTILGKMFKQPANMADYVTRWDQERLAPYSAAVARCKAMPESFEGIAKAYPWFPAASLPVITKSIQENDADFKATIAKLKPSPFSSPIVVLMGTTGAGKTTSALGMFLLYMRAWREHLIRQAQQALERAASGEAVPRVAKPLKAVFVAAKDVVDARQFSPLGREPELLERAKSASLLILDDIVGTRDTDQDLYQVIWSRDNFKLPTIVTTAMNPAEMTASYSEMFTRRVFGGTSKLITRKP